MQADYNTSPPGGDFAWKGGDAHGKFSIKPIKETNHGMAQDCLTAKVFYISSHETLNEIFMATYDGVFPRTP